jgi:lipopolysaccharide/colanic/teichoic acid biosynthesis glycosyltransferase
MIYAEESPLTTIVPSRQDSRVSPADLSDPSALSSEFQAGVPRWKRALDVCLILLSLPLTGPVMLLMACLIKIVSPGSVFYTQERVGHNGKTFRLFKFRTMRADSAATPHQDYLRGLVNSNAPMAKLDEKDSRVIPCGRVIRASGLDELAQLINVVLGEMSLVGPRPCTPYEYEHYQEWQKERFSALPGLTGLWQVSGKNNTTFVEMIHLDIKYARHQSLFRDCWILISTPAVVLGQVSQLLRSRLGAKASQTQTVRQRSVVSGS